MVQKHMQLFPINVTDCQIYPCHPFCPPSADCYFGPYPDFFFPLPPPPPPPPPISSHSTFTLSPYVIISLSLFAVVSVLAASYVVIVKYCFRRRRRSGARSDDRLDFLDINHGPEIDHPIWYINSIGLQPSVINSIAVFKYKRGDAPIEGSACSVCLSEFGDDEMLRLLPKCNHAFHISCIDTWLRSHTNCPLCRAGILFDAEGLSGYMKHLLSSTLASQRFPELKERDKVKAWCREIGERVKERMLQIEPNNFKFAVITQIYEKRGQGGRADLCCHWEDTDAVAQAMFDNDTLICFCIAFAMRVSA